MKQNTFKVKSTFIFLVALVVMLVIVWASYSNYKMIQDNVIEIEQMQLLSLAETLSVSIENFFMYQQHSLEILTKNRSFVRDFQGVDSGNEGEDLFQNLEDYYTIQSENVILIRLVDVDGKELYAYPTTDYSDGVLADIANLKEPDAGTIYKENSQLYVNIYQPTYENGEVKAMLYIKVALNRIYESLISSVRAGEKGYASVKDSNGMLIMHPNTKDIGENVIEARQSTYPDFDWSELEVLVQKQKNKESGVGVYHSLWFTDNDQERVKKFSAYAPAEIGSTFWIVNVSKDYLEVVSFLKERTYSIIIINFFILLLFVTFGLVFYRLRKDRALIEKERDLLKQVERLNGALKKDIEVRIELEKELIKSKNKFEKIFESGSDCIFVVSMDHSANIIEVNTKVMQSLKYSKEKLLNSNYFDISTQMTKEGFEKIVDDLKDQPSVIFEDLLLTEIGTYIPVEINARIMFNEEQAQVVMISRDISMKKLFELEMEESKKKEALMIYQSRLAAMGEMIGNIAHQWRQPLSGLSMIYSNLIDAYRYHELDETFLLKQGKRHDELVKFMSHTIDDFRFFFDPKTETKAFLISNVMDKTLDFLKETIRLNNVEVEYSIKTDVLLNGYPNQLSQVLFSIIKNAMDAIITSSHESKKIWIRIDKKSEELWIQIEDTGGGADHQLIHRIFEAYFTTKDTEHGTGLGLYISKVIVEKNFRGLITAQNSEHGLCITIKIPLAHRE